MKHVLAPISKPFAPDVASVLNQYPQGKNGYIIQLFRVFANSRRFLTQTGPRNLLDKESPLSMREREIVILRVTANADCEYEWGIHVNIFAKAAGLTDEQVSATRTSCSNESCWSAEERLLLDCVDEICRYSKIQDGTYSKFQQQWDLDQQLEILALCGSYHLVSFVANTSRIPLEEDARTFPATVS